MTDLEGITQAIWSIATVYGTKVIGGIVVLLLGLWIIRGINKLIAKGFEKKGVDPTLQPFLKSIISALLKVLLAITVLSMIGVAMTSFIALIGAAGLAIGLALQGTLQNFAGGVLILLFKPFKVGDFIESQGFLGVVQEIQIFVTTLKTPDNKIVIIPNSPLFTNSLVNYSREPIRRIDLVFGISYSDDIDKAREIILKVLSQEELVLKDPASFVGVGELGDNSVNFMVRPWVKTEHYWDVYFRVHENVKKAFDNEGVSIPFPQRDVHLFQQSAS